MSSIKSTFTIAHFLNRLLHCTFAQMKKYKDYHKKIRIFRYRVLFAAWKRWIQDHKSLKRLDKFFILRNRSETRLKLHSIWAQWKHEV